MSKRVGTSKRGLSDANKKEMEDMIARAIGQAMLTMEQCIDPLEQRMTRAERVIKKLSVLNQWGSTMSGMVDQGVGQVQSSRQDMIPSATGQKNRVKTPIGHSAEKADKEKAARDAEKKAMAELRKTIKHMESCLAPIQARMGNCNTALNQLQKRLCTVETLQTDESATIKEHGVQIKALQSMPVAALADDASSQDGASAEGEKGIAVTLGGDGATAVIAVAHGAGGVTQDQLDKYASVHQDLFEMVLEPLQLRVDSLDALYPSISSRTSAIEARVFDGTAFQEVVSGEAAAGSEDSADQLIASRMKGFEGLMGGLMTRLSHVERNVEQVGERSQMGTARWGLVEKHKNQVQALLERNERESKEMRVEWLNQKPSLQLVPELNRRVDGFDKKLNDLVLPPDTDGADGEGSRSVMRLLQSNLTEIQVKLAAVESNSRDNDIQISLIRRGSGADISSSANDDILATTVVGGETAIRVVSGPRTNNGHEWAMGRWDQMVNTLCDLHNRAWETVAKQLGILESLEVFARGEIHGMFEEDELDSSIVERRFIKQLEQALAAKVDCAVAETLELQVGEMHNALTDLKEKVEVQLGLGNDIENIEERVGEMIRAAVPVEADIESRLQGLFENKMISRQELEGHLEDRLQEMEEALQDKLLGGGGSRLPSPLGSRAIDSRQTDLHTVERSSQQQRDKTHASVKGMQDSLSSKADRKELLRAIEGVEKQVPGSQDRLATALAARAHCYQTLRCLSCDAPGTPPNAATWTGGGGNGAMLKVATPTGSGQNRSSVGALIPRNAKRKERLINIRSLLEKQERALTSDGTSRDSLKRSPTAFLHLMPRGAHTASSTSIVGANSPRSATYRHMVSPLSELDHSGNVANLRGFSDQNPSDQLQDVNMSLGLHVRGLPNMAMGEKTWSPELAREIRKGFNF